MKEILTRNISLKILSVLLAALLWLVITNIDNPAGTRPFTDMPVKILNENLINTPNQGYEITEGETIDFKVAARRTILDSLERSDFIVTADFADLSNVNSVIINITCKKAGVTITDGKYQTLKISIEELTEENYKVNIIQKGEVSDGNYVGETTANPNMITVSGPKSRIERIKEIAVEVDVTGASRTFSKYAEPKALDQDGKEIDTSRLTFSKKYITVDIELYKKKDINLQITANGEPEDGYIVKSVEYEPKTVTVAGEAEKLSEIKYLPVEIDISGAYENIEREIELREYLPKGIVLVDEDQTAALKITIERLETKEITIWPNDIHLKNKDDSLKATYITTGPITLKVRGPGDEIAGISRTTLKPYIDLADCKIGTYELPVSADLSDKIEIIDAPVVRLAITQ